ncbi:MAG: PfkB protein [Bacteroidetes bacterium]|nr:PfkB protein [Bacteroidota bacterium]
MNHLLLTSILNRIRTTSVGVVGDFCLDAYWQLDEGEPELSLETGKPTFAVAQQHYSLGGAGNVVNNIAALGVGRVCAYGVLGEDLFGEELLRRLKAVNTDPTGLIRQEADWQTSVYAKPYRGPEEQSRIDFGRHNALSQDSEQKLIAALTEGIVRLDALAVNQQIPKSIFTPGVIAALNSLALQYPDKVFLVDSRHRIREFGSMICKLNAIETAALFGTTIRKNEDCAIEELGDYAKRLFEQSRKPVFITRSRRGLLLFDGNGTSEIPAIEVEEPIDPVGAGDTVVAALASALAAGATLLEAGSFAMVAASITVRKLQQTGTARPEEILQLAQSPP